MPLANWLPCRCGAVSKRGPYGARRGRLGGPNPWYPASDESRKMVRRRMYPRSFPLAGVPRDQVSLHPVLPARVLHRLYLCVLFFFLLASAAAVHASSPEGQHMGEDVYVSGRDLTLDSNVSGDAVVMGGKVVLRGSVGGDATVAGGDIEVQSVVGGTLHAVGGEVHVDGYVRGNVRVAGGSVTLAHAAQVEGSLAVFARKITLSGFVRHYALLSGSDVYIDGVVQGDVQVLGGNLTVGRNAVIHGRLDYRGDGNVRVEPGARIAGGIAQPEDSAGPRRPGVGTGVMLVGLIVVAALFIGLAPAGVRAVTRGMRAHPGWAFFIGLLVLVGVPMAIIALAVTVVGIPLALLLVCCFAMLVLLGYLAFAVALADWAVDRSRPAPAWLRTMATVVTLIVLFVLAQTPYVGWLVWIFAAVLGTGAIVRSVVAALSWKRANG